MDLLHFSIDGKVIENVSSFNVLGITLDEGLTWKNHMDLIKNKISKTIGVFYRLAKIFPEEILVTLYNSLICFTFKLWHISMGYSSNSS